MKKSDESTNVRTLPVGVERVRRLNTSHEREKAPATSGPTQYTDVLMLPVGSERARRLAEQVIPSGSLAQYIPFVELLFGIASIEDAQVRQAVALSAVRQVFTLTVDFDQFLAFQVAAIYRDAADAPPE